MVLMFHTRRVAASSTLGILLIALAAIVGALTSVDSAHAQSSSLQVNMAIWVSEEGYAELCVDLHDTQAGRTRQCPDRRRFVFDRAPEGRWLRSAALHIAPEVSIYARARRSGNLLHYGLGVTIEGETRALSSRTWQFDWGAAEPNRWVTSRALRLRLPVAPHAELWPVQSGMVAGAHRLEVGKPAPEFLLPALGSPSETLVSLSRARSGGEQLTLIVFWSSWAPFVGETLNVLSDLAARQDDVLVIGVNVYEVDEGAGEAFARNYGTDLLHLVDTTGEVAQHYRVDGIPELFVLDERGIYRGVIRGAAPLTQILYALTTVE